jgi:hypothetical protein
MIVSQFGHVLIQSVPEAACPSFLACSVLAMVARPTARMAPKPSPSNSDVLKKSCRAKPADSPGMKSEKVTVDTIPAAPIPTSGYLIAVPFWLPSNEDSSLLSWKQNILIKNSRFHISIVVKILNLYTIIVDITNGFVNGR